MAYPAAYRGGSGAGALARPAPMPGFQWPSGPSPKWFPKAARGAARVAPRLLGAVGFAVTAVELYRYWASGTPIFQNGWGWCHQCPSPPNGAIMLLDPTSCTICAACSPVCPSYNRSTNHPNFAFTHLSAWQPKANDIRAIVTGSNDFIVPYRVEGFGVITRPAPGAGAPVLPPVWFPQWWAAVLPYAKGNVMAQPVAQPVGRPVPPVAWPAGKPAVPALPEDSVGGQPPGVGVRPGVSTVFTPGGVRVVPTPEVRARVAPHTREQKLRMSPGVAAFVHLFNAYTEYSDLVNALYSSLKDGSPCKVSGGTTMQFKQDAVFQCFGDIDWDTALFNVLWENVEDRVRAMIGIPTKGTVLPYGGNLPVNVALRDVVGKPIRDETAYVEAVTRSFVGRILGLDLSAKSAAR